MAHYFLYPEKDSTIFESNALKLKNSGNDEILEIEKSFDYIESQDIHQQNRRTRVLIKFNFENFFNNWTIEDIINRKFYLNLKTVEAKEIPFKYSILGFPISQSWESGTGRKYDGMLNDGVNWKYRDYAAGSGSFWISGSTETDEFGGGTWYVSGSIYDSSGSFISASLGARQDFYYNKSDIKMDITNMVHAWYSSEIPNEGIILMHSGEDDNRDYFQLRFFSKETNTIYSPYIDIQWDDSEFITGSLLPLTSKRKVIVLPNLQNEYKYGSVERIEVFGREQYPLKTFGMQSDYLVVKYLPSSSYYSIRDAYTEEVLVDFDDYSKISCDEEGNYFILDTNGFPQERYFRIEIKIIDGKTIQYYNTNKVFKIVR